MGSGKRRPPPRYHSSLLLIAMLFWPASALGASAGEVFEKVKDAVVVVKALGEKGEELSQGSGVMLPSGQLATNHHVVEQGLRLRGVANAHAVAGLIVAKDPDRDLALLSAPGLNASPAQQGRAESLKVGQRVFAMGAPYGPELSISEGILSQLRGKKPSIIQTTAAASPGSSGGGLFNEKGQLVGITTFHLKGGQGLNFAVPVERVGELIAQRKKAAPPPAAKTPKPDQAPASPPESRGPTLAVDYGTGLPDSGGPEYLTTWLSQAVALEAAQDWSGLVEHCERWIKAQPGEGLGWYGLGMAYNSLGRHEEAVGAYKEALRLKPDFAEAWYNLGVAYLRLGRHEEAVSAIKEALRLKADFVAEAWLALGVAYWGLGNRSEALKAIKELRRYDPVRADELFNLIMGR